RAVRGVVARSAAPTQAVCRPLGGARPVRYTRRHPGSGCTGHDRGRGQQRSGPGLMGLSRMRPSHEILSGDSADVYFVRAETILAKEGLDSLALLVVFQ